MIKIRQSVSEGKKFGYLEKVTSTSDLPDKETLIRLIEEAMAINEQGVRKSVSKPKAENSFIIEVPNFFAEALDQRPEAKEIFESKSASFRKDYLVWITAAKTDATRDKRINESIEWIAQGKGRFWQYQK
jgi:uncharacterized protein YdeI (YjbR/CyaY-like superfamily)